MTLVAGIDSSTQTCKVVVRDLETGVLVREGKASHPAGTIVHPEVWWTALLTAVRRAGGLEDVGAISISGQQHTPVFLDHRGAVICDSPLWNDTGSHEHMLALNHELGKEEWITRTGLPLTLSDTVTKLRWLRDTRPDAARQVAAVAVVHDWLTWRLAGFGPDVGGIERLTTDRSEASGTAYWSGETEDYCRDLLVHALGKDVVLPVVLGPFDRAGVTGQGIPGIAPGVPLGVGSGDNHDGQARLSPRHTPSNTRHGDSYSAICSFRSFKRIRYTLFLGYRERGRGAEACESNCERVCETRSCADGAGAC